MKPKKEAGSQTENTFFISAFFVSNPFRFFAVTFLTFRGCGTE